MYDRISKGKVDSQLVTSNIHNITILKLETPDELSDITLKE
jgi:hypothetical protein